MAMVASDWVPVDKWAEWGSDLVDKLAVAGGRGLVLAAVLVALGVRLADRSVVELRGVPESLALAQQAMAKII
jgi:hypothetical protein